MSRAADSSLRLHTAGGLEMTEYVQSSAEAAGDVGLRARIAGRGEELRRGAELDELSGQQKSGEIADAAACCIL